MKTHNSKDIVMLLPTLGIIIFIGLFIFSAHHYPGGSQASFSSKGFDWMNNYWCNLLNDYAINGQKNPARPIAILAMILLCTSVTLFFFQFVKFFNIQGFWKSSIQFSGTLSMISAGLIFTKYHDLMTAISSLFGIFVVTAIIRTIYLSQLSIFKLSGIICIVLLGINNLIYYSHYYIEYLPIIQKITFLLVLFWIAGLNITMRNSNTIEQVKCKKNYPKKYDKTKH